MSAALDENANSPPEDYLRAECDHLLEAEATDAASQDGQPTDPDGLLGQGPDAVLASAAPADPAGSLAARRRKAFLIRTLALLCACSLSVGSH